MIRNTIVVFVVIAIALFVWLKSGIAFDRIAVGGYHIEQLYIKLDKKLTLKASHITIPRAKASPSFGTVDKTFDRIKYLLTFFEYIELKKLDFNNNHLNVIYADNTLYITTDMYEIAGGIERRGKMLYAAVSMLYIKKYDIRITGSLTYDIKRHILATEGNFDAFHIKGSFRATKEGNRIGFTIATERFEDLRSVIDLFGTLHPAVKSWIVDRIRSKHYTLYSLTGEGRLDSEGRFGLDIDSLKGEAMAEDADIYFQKGLDPIVARRLYIHYREGALFFDLDTPRYKQIDLNGSRISIPGLADRHAVLKLDLKLKAPIDSEVQKILASYNIDLPIRYSGKYATATLKIDLPLKKRKKHEKPKVKVFVHVDLKRGLANYRKITLPIRQGWVEFNNTKQYPLKAGVILDKGDAQIEDATLPVVSGRLSLANDKIELHEVHMKRNWIDLTAKGVISLPKKRASFTALIKHFEAGAKEKYLQLRNKTLPVKMSFGKGVEANIVPLTITATKRRRGVVISVEHLAKLKPYLKEIPFDFQDGKVTVTIKDLQHYAIKGSLKSCSSFFYEKDNSCYTTLPFEVTIAPKGVSIEAFQRRLKYDVNKERIDLKQLNIDLKRLLTLYINHGKVIKKSEKNAIAKRKELVIIGKESHIRYGEHTLVTDSYDIAIKPNGDIKAIGSQEGNIVKFDKKGRYFTLKALRVTDRLLHPLVNFKGLHGGRYSISMEGDPDNEVKGRIIIEGGALSGFGAYNNTLAFLNTIPALVTLQDPGFSTEGFKIKKGVIEYRQYNDTVLLDSIYIQGATATIAGTGTVDLRHNRLDISLVIHTARELGKIVGNLPLLGYIIMGKDKSVTIGLKITGTIDKPEVTTMAAKKILTLPIDILKRTLESPAHIINQ